MNPNGHIPSTQRGDRASYILNILEGDVRRITLPDSDSLTTCRCRQKPLASRTACPPPPAPAMTHVASRGPAVAQAIEHVFYIIKENRTYDQVARRPAAGKWGQLSRRSLAREHHTQRPARAGRALCPARQHVLLRRSERRRLVLEATQGMAASAYAARNVPYNYSGQSGRKFDFEGQNNGYLTGGFPTTGPEATPTRTNPLLSQGGESNTRRRQHQRSPLGRGPTGDGVSLPQLRLLPLLRRHAPRRAFPAARKTSPLFPASAPAATISPASATSTTAGSTWTTPTSAMPRIACLKKTGNADCLFARTKTYGQTPPPTAEASPSGNASLT